MKLDNYKDKIDFGIITIREDEFKAVIKRFPAIDTVRGNRYYGISSIKIDENEEYLVAIVRCIEQGNNEAQDAVRDIIEDLSPSWIILVGIAGGVPEYEFTIGDVVLSTKLSDFSIEASLGADKVEYSLGGGHINKEIQVLLAHLPAMDDKIRGWNDNEAISYPCPVVTYDSGKFYGDSDWNEKVIETLKIKFDKNGAPLRDPKYICGTVASSNRLMKDPELVSNWQSYSRHITAVEMELSGAYQAARRYGKEYPVFAIRGISDIVGYKRSHKWTEYACNIAASFTRYFLKLRPVEPKVFTKEQFQKNNPVHYKSQLSLKRCTIELFDTEEYFNSLSALPIAIQYCSIFEQITNLSILSLQLFIIATLRCYEDLILRDDISYRKKVKPLLKDISENYRIPSFKTFLQTAKLCWHLIDSKAPPLLVKMKESLGSDILLLTLGAFLDDLELLFPKSEGKLVYKEKAKTKKSLLKFFFPELAIYTRKPRELVKSLILVNFTTNRIKTWMSAFVALKEHLSILLENKFILRKMPEIFSATNKCIIKTKEYYKNELKEYQNEATMEDNEELQTNISLMELGDGKYVHMFPFILIKHDSLFFYRRTLAAGYEYFSIINNETYIKETKKKFNHAIFRTGSKQELFWTDVSPTINANNRIKANIPDEGLAIKFVGRHKHRKAIFEEILEIPNQNGIIYGPGGIGKTSLMLQISKDLFEEEDQNKVLFDNIIWVSAKSDYYDHIFNTIETRKAQYKTLDSIIAAILYFFEYENLNEYDFDGRKELVLEILQENRVLLILDNFESISDIESNKIVNFFETNVKRRLRKYPNNFKTIITSRVQIPSGFHQIELSGLSRNESKQLLMNMYENYQTSKDELTDQQQIDLYSTTKGIPVVLKHCFMQYYEYNKLFDEIIRNLSNIESEIIQFSFKEILKQIESEDEGRIRLKIIVLMESINCPLMARQISDILEIEEKYIINAIPCLIDLQCLKRINQNKQEKYIINDDIRILTKSLTKNNMEIYHDIKDKITRNYDIDKKMDYTTEELGILSIFRDYLNEKNYLEAEDFIIKQLKEKPNSIMLKMHYAKYLVDMNKEKDKAIEVLEGIREASGNHKKILFLLVECYTKQDVPKYQKAQPMVIELEKSLSTDEERRLIAEYYISWSFSKKNQKKELDHLKERIRQQEYKEMAEKAIEHLENIKEKDHNIYYLLSQSFFNCWEYDSAMVNINKAIDLSAKQPTETFHPYERFKYLIDKKIEQYSKIAWKKRTKYSESTK